MMNNDSGWFHYFLILSYYFYHQSIIYFVETLGLYSLLRKSSPPLDFSTVCSVIIWNSNFTEVFTVTCTVLGMCKILVVIQTIITTKMKTYVRCTSVPGVSIWKKHKHISHIPMTTYTSIPIKMLKYVLNTKYINKGQWDMMQWGVSLPALHTDCT